MEIACSISWFRNWNEAERVEFGKGLLEKERTDRTSVSGSDTDLSLDSLMNTMNSLSLNTGTKGQIISKGLFGILGFFQKTNARIHF